MLQRLIVTLFLVCGIIAFWAYGQSSPEPKTERVALIIANSEYETVSWKLANPVNDAMLIEEALIEVGFEVHTILDATEDEMEDAFKAHGERLAVAGPNATGIFFFAGHGVQSEGYNYLLPVDLYAQSEQDVWAGAPRLDNLFQHLRRSGNKTNFVILDACRNNPLLSSTRNISGGLARAPEAHGTLIAYATAPGAVANDGVDDTNSPYSKALAEYITEPGIVVESLFRRVRTRVETVTAGGQRPWMESGLSGNDFCFAGCNQIAFAPDDEAQATEQTLSLAKNLARALNAFRDTYPESTGLSPLEGEVADVLSSALSEGVLKQITAVDSAEEQALLEAIGKYDLWPNGQISVCWETPSPDIEDSMRWVQEAVEESWERVADVDFTGWGACEADSSGVRIAMTDKGPSATQLGYLLNGVENGLTQNFEFSSWGKGCSKDGAYLEYCIRALAVHSFGHVLGLGHEQNREDRPDTCTAEPQGPMHLGKPPYLTDYDPNSVMNYCAPNWNNNGNLSVRDVAKARLLYGER